MTPTDLRQQLEARLAHIRAAVHNDPRQAIAASVEAQSVAESLVDAHARADVILLRATASLTASEFDAARALANSLAGADLSPRQQATLLRIRAILAQRAGDLTSALSLAPDAA